MAMTHSADSWQAGTRRLGRDGPDPGTVAHAAAERSAAVPARARTIRSWPLLVLAAPAAAEVWSGWVGIAQNTGLQCTYLVGDRGHVRAPARL